MLAGSDKAATIASLLEAKKNIASTMRRHKSVIDFLKTVGVTTQSIVDVVHFAENITPPTFAPRGWQSGCPFGHPPAPQVEQMRNGFLGIIDVVASSDLTSIASEQSSTLDNIHIELPEQVVPTITVSERKRKFNDVSEGIVVERTTAATSVPMHRFQNAVVKPLAAKSKSIDMNFGFSSDSESDDSDGGN